LHPIVWFICLTTNVASGLLPNQIPPLGIHVSCDLHALGFRKKSVAQSTTVATPPWLFSRPVFDLRLHCSDKDTTPPDNFKNHFMNCVAATRISITSTPMVLRLVTNVVASSLEELFSTVDVRTT